MGHQRKESQAHHEVKASMEWRAVVQECWSLLHLHLGFGYVCKGLEGTSADKCVPFHVCFTPSLLMIVSVIHKHRHIYIYAVQRTSSSLFPLCYRWGYAENDWQDGAQLHKWELWWIYDPLLMLLVLTWVSGIILVNVLVVAAVVAVFKGKLILKLRDYSQDLDALLLSKPANVSVEHTAMWQDHVGKQLAKLGPNGMEVQETTEADIEEAEESRTCCHVWVFKWMDLILLWCCLLIKWGKAEICPVSSGLHESLAWLSRSSHLQPSEQPNWVQQACAAGASTFKI